MHTSSYCTILLLISLQEVKKAALLYQKVRYEIVVMVLPEGRASHSSSEVFLHEILGQQVAITDKNFSNDFLEFIPHI